MDRNPLDESDADGWCDADDEAYVDDIAGDEVYVGDIAELVKLTRDFPPTKGTTWFIGGDEKWEAESNGCTAVDVFAPVLLW